MPGPDRRLRQVDRRDRALLELAQRVGQLGLQRGDEAAPVGGRRVLGARAQREDDRGGEGVRADWLIIRFASSLRIGQVAVIAQPDRIIPSSSVSQPVDAVAVVVGLGLLERVVDGDREVGERGLASAREDLPEAVLEEVLRARPCRRGDTGWRRAPRPSGRASC